MARRRRGRARGLVAVVVVAAAAALGGWAWHQGWYRGVHFPAGTSAVPLVDASHVDHAREGQAVAVEGALRVAAPARDPEFGITADAPVLVRDVRMLQWQERCPSTACDYRLDWSGAPVDSSAFRDPHGHANPPRFPFASARFAAGDVRIGAYHIDPRLAGAGGEEHAWPVTPAQLPPNLAATFWGKDGVLYAGADPKHPAAGDLRVSYRIVPVASRRIEGVLAGDRIVPNH